MTAPSGHLLQAGQLAGKTLTDLLQRDSLELARRLQPEDATHELYAGALLESSYFLLAVIQSSAQQLLKDDATARDFTDAMADTFLRSLLTQESEIFEAPGFEDRYFGTLDDRLNEYTKTPALGVYDKFGLFQFAFAPDMPSTEPAFTKFVQQLTAATKETIDEPIQSLLRSHIEETMDELQLNLTLPVLARLLEKKEAPQE